MDKKLLILFLSVLFIAGCRRGKITINDYGFFVDNCTAPYKVEFYVDVDYIGTKISYYWDFGDGEHSEEQNPIHYYKHKGIYYVKLLIENYKATEEIEMGVNVSRDTMKPIASFEYDSQYDNFYAPASINFYNKSQYASSFFWNFGDGYGSDEVSPTHEYTDSGSYVVTLKASCKGDSSITSKTINILPPPSEITLQTLEVYMPDEYLGGTYKLHYYLDNFDETPLQLDYVVADDFPIGWELDDNLFYFDGEYDNSVLYFEIWEIHDMSAPVYSFGIHLNEIQQEHYPTELTWDDGDFGAKLTLEYH